MHIIKIVIDPIIFRCMRFLYRWGRSICLYCLMLLQLKIMVFMYISYFMYVHIYVLCIIYLYTYIYIIWGVARTHKKQNFKACIHKR